MTLNPYLNFDGNAEEAFRFYHSVFGGNFFIQKMGQSPGTENLSEEEKNRAMHVAISIGKQSTSYGFRLYIEPRTCFKSR